MCGEKLLEVSPLLQNPVCSLLHTSKDVLAFASFQCNRFQSQIGMDSDGEFLPLAVLHLKRNLHPTDE